MKQLATICFALLSLSAFAQIRVSGTVTDAATGEALFGVSVAVKNTSTGAVSDINGQFVVSVTDANATLTVSYTGYESQEIALAGRTSLDVKLAVAQNVINEIVVVGWHPKEK